MKTQYILMADIIDSREKDELILMWQFKELVHDINYKYSNKISSPLTITLGDEFQGIISEFENLLKIIFFIEEQIIKKGSFFKLRYAISESDIDHINLNTYASYGMLSEGLIKTREALNHSKKNKSRFNFLLKNMDEKKALKLELLFSCYQAKIDSWDRKDKDIIKEYLDNNRDYKGIASVLNMYDSTIWKKLNRLDIETYINIKRLIELDFY
ncbi:SatD family protein [Acinetobacter nosocomialis]|uniref:SatD family protein n=1 Tax=Acinetobacter nosocomialis TaxID=106654 RepID=UPI0034628377